MLGKTEFERVVQEPVKSTKNSVEEENDQIELNKTDNSKLVIQLNLNKQNFHQDEVTQIIREIFDISNHTVEIEKVPLPTNDDKWQVKKVNNPRKKGNLHLSPSSSMHLMDRSRISNKKKFLKYNKLCKVTSLKSLCRTRHGSRKKLLVNPSRESGSNQFDTSQVHSSSAITNLLSQLYPNPYNLISSLEVQNKSKNSVGSKSTVNVSHSCKINFQAKDGLNKNSEQEFASFNVPDVFYKNIYYNSINNYNQKEICKNKSAGGNYTEKNKSKTQSDIFMFSGIDQTQGKIEEDQTVKGSIQTFAKTQMGSGEMNSVQEVHPKNKNVEEPQMEAGEKTQSNMIVPDGIQNQKRSKMKESKMLKKNSPKIISLTDEKMDENKHKKNPVKHFESSGEKFCNTKIQPLTLQVIKKKKDNTNNQNPTKKKDVIQYLKLIKDLYEQEEKCLKIKIDDAWHFALNQIEKSKKTSTKRKNLESVQKPTKDKEYKNSQSQTPISKKEIMDKKKSNSLSQQKNKELTESTKGIINDNGELTQPYIKSVQKKSAIPEHIMLDNNKKSNSQLYNHQKFCQLTMFKNPYSNVGLITRKPNTIRTDTFVFSRKIMKNESSETEELPIEIINKNALETNKKIDLLIKHIDNSMNWLSQSENAKPSSMNSILEKANDLSEKLEENLNTPESGSITLSKTNMESLRFYGHKNMTYSNSNLLLAPSYQSLHIFPVDRMGNLRIRSSTFFNNDIRNRNSLWLGSDGIRHLSLNNIIIPHSKSANYLMSENRVTMPNRTIPAGGHINIFQRTVESEIPELHTTTEPAIFFIENTNEHGSLTEYVNDENQQREDNFDTNNIEVINRSNNIFNVNPKNLPSPLALSIITLDDSLSSLRPVIMQEIIWSFPIPISSPVMKMYCLDEQHMIYTTAEVNVLHVARTTYFIDLVLTNVVRIMEQEQELKSSVITSPDKCSGFIDNNDQPGQDCEFAVLPIHTEKISENMVEEGQEMSIKILKGVGSNLEKIRKKWERCDWDSFLSESSLEMYDKDKAAIRDLDAILKRSDRYRKNIEWLNPILDPYESNPGDDEIETPKLKQTNLQSMNNASLQGCHIRDFEQEIFPNLNNKNHRNMKFSGLETPLIRYYSSETSNTSLDEKDEKKMLDGKKMSDHTRRISKFSNTNFSLFPDIKITDDNVNPIEERKNEKQENDSSSTSSFKSSNDLSDVSDLPELNYSKKKTKSRSHFLNKIFHEIRSFRKCLTKQKGSKLKTAQEDSNEFQDALSELNMENQENKCIKLGERDAINEDGLVNSVCLDEVRNHSIPRKIFKTSFRGKESVTELMIDFKDASISEVSDISVEKRKLSTDHTKISILISKQPDGKCCTFECHRNRELPIEEHSSKTLNDTSKSNRLSWNDIASKSDDDTYDDDYLSADSCTESKSFENISVNNQKENIKDKMLIRDNLIEPEKKERIIKKHKFDFYKKMENTSFNGSEVLFSKYEKEIAPLQKTLADMQFRIHNIQKKTFCTSDEYYERALKMAKMSAGYCQLCKSKTVIPEDPLGIYQNLIPRTSFYSPYSNHRKYYFKTSSTNSSFYSIHSSNSDISDKFCHLNSSSSIITNRLTRNRGPMLRESTSNNIPVFFGRTVHF